jgi:hypothetical protein
VEGRRLNSVMGFPVISFDASAYCLAGLVKSVAEKNKPSSILRSLKAPPSF